MSKLLFDESPLVVDRTLAKAIGINEAILVQQVHYWLTINAKKNINLRDGKYWTYDSLKSWHEKCFDFWSFDTVRRTFAKLEDLGILIVGNYNEDRRDRTKWYTIDYETLEKVVEESGAKCKLAKCTNANWQNAQMQIGKLPRPLPENSTENSTEKDIQQQSNNIYNINNQEEISNKQNNVVVVGPLPGEQSDKLKEIRDFCRQESLDLFILLTEDAGYMSELLRMAGGDTGVIRDALLASWQYYRTNDVPNLKGLVRQAVADRRKPSPETKPQKSRQKEKDKYRLLFSS